MANWISDFRYAFRALTRVSAVLALVTGIGLLAGGATAGAQDWPSWRGPQDNGMARGDAPLAWSETDHVKWKAAIPGRGHSSPVVWGDQIFVTTAVQIGS